MTGSAACQRMVALALGLGVCFAVLTARLSCLHLGLTKPIEKPKPYDVVLPAKRGTIFDCQGNPLATVVPVRQLFVDPSRVPTNDAAAVVTTLSHLLKRDPAELAEIIRHTNQQFVALAYITDETLANNLQSCPLPFHTNPAIARNIETNILFRGRVGFNRVNLRCYPLGSELCQVLGYYNGGTDGVFGLERYLNRFLTGEDGRIVGEADARRKEILERRRSYKAPRDGCSVELTIDQTIQHHAEMALDAVMAKHNATSAWAIVMRCRTGEILAMASRPSADPTKPTTTDQEPWRNRTVATNYEPGSTLKVLTIAAALNEGLITTNTIIDCENGSWYYAGKPLRDKVHGPSDMTMILRKSSNIGTAKTALLLGSRSLEAYLRLAGFGSATGLELPGEESGMLAPAKSWPLIKTTRVAIGQGIAVTALQMVSLYSAVANDGQRMRPILVRRITSPTGEVIVDRLPTPAKAPLMRPEVSRQMRAMLETVTQPGGTGTRAAVPGYRVAGKTGTAQIAGVGGYSSTEYTSSFVGFLPAPNPEIAIIVAVERPHPIHVGGLVAAPAFAEIALQTVRYLNIPPTETVPEIVPLWDPEPEPETEAFWEDPLP